MRLNLVVMSCVFLCSFSVSYAQVRPQDLNVKLLEHQIKTLIDSTRFSHGLPALYNDSILYVASNHHANYLNKKGALSHYEPESEIYNAPQDRALAYGAPHSYLVGENVAYTLYNSEVRVKGKRFLTLNSMEIARSLVCSWVNSRGHFKNIIDPDYQVTGLSVSIDPETKRVYACQKFAHVQYTYSFEENKSFFSYSDMENTDYLGPVVTIPEEITYPFGLRADETEKCEECKDVWEEYPGLSVRIKRNNFILRVEDAEFVKDLIENRRDGFAIELVPFEPFACGNPKYEKEPSRRNEMKRTSGRVLEPVYRKELMKGFKRRKRKKDMKFVNYLFTADSVSFFKRFGRYKLNNFEAKYFEMKLGRIPKDMQSWWNHNLVYIHDKQICHFVYLTNYPGELELEFIDVPYYPPQPINNYEFVLDHYADTVELFYPPNGTTASGQDLNNLIAKYRDNNVTVTDIQIDGYCSVEGDIAENDRLHRERASNILEGLRSTRMTDSVYRIKSTVAWDHFYSAVREDPKWKFLYAKSQSEITNYLMNPNNERPLKILKEERKVKVVIAGVRELNPENALYYIKRDLPKFYYKGSRGELHCVQGDGLQRLYEKAFYFSTVDTLTTAEFLSIELRRPQEGFSHNLQHEEAFYRYHYLKDSVVGAELKKAEGQVEYVFEMCGAAEHLSPEFHYLSAGLLVDQLREKGNKNTSDNPTIEKAFDRLNLLLNWYELDSVFHLDVAKANLNIVNILCETIDPELIYEYNDIINRSLIHIVEYYRKTNQLNPERVLSLAKFLCYFKNVPLAVDICRDYLYDDEVLKLYLPLAYTHSSYLSSDWSLAFEAHFYGLIKEAKTRLSSEEWCALFYGQYGIPFQVMDNADLHNEFCATCPDRVNEVLAE